MIVHAVRVSHSSGSVETASRSSRARLPLYVAGVLTELHLRLSRTTLNFGISDNTTRRIQFLKVYNPSLLIASYGFRSSDRALRVLEPPHFSDLHETPEEQQTSGNGQESPPGAGGFSDSPLPQDGSNAAIGATGPPKGDKSDATKPVGPLGPPLDGSQETVSLVHRQANGKVNEEWQALCQHLPPLDCGGTGVLLPGETRTFAVVLDPGELRSDAHALQLATGKAVEREGVVRVRVLLASQAAYEVKIPWTATVLESPVAVLPAPTLKLAAVPIGQSTSATLELRLVAPHLALGRGEIGGTRRQAKPPEAAAKQAMQSAAVLIEVQQPPPGLSALSITPRRVILCSNKLSASLFFRFAPTEQYIQLGERQSVTQTDEAAEDKQLPPPINPELTKSGSEKRIHLGGGSARDGSSQTAATSGVVKGREGQRKGGKAEINSEADSKTATDKSHTQGDINAKPSKAALKSVGGGGEAGEVTAGGSLEPSAEPGGNGVVAALPIASLSDGGIFSAMQLDRTTDVNVKTALLKVAEAGGGRWTSSEEEGSDGFFAFDSPTAYHHARWLIPLRICRLTAKQGDPLLPGEEVETTEFLPGSSAYSYIEVSKANN